MGSSGSRVLTGCDIPSTSPEGPHAGPGGTELHDVGGYVEGWPAGLLVARRFIGRSQIISAAGLPETVLPTAPTFVKSAKSRQNR